MLHCTASSTACRVLIMVPAGSLQGMTWPWLSSGWLCAFLVALHGDLFAHLGDLEYTLWAICHHGMCSSQGCNPQGVELWSWALQ